MSKKRLAIIGNQAFSMVNFRGSLIRDIVARGHEVFAFAPDFDEASRGAVRALGAVPMDHWLERTGMNPVSDARGLLDLVLRLRRIKPDVSLGYSIKPVTYGTIAAWLAGVPSRHAMIEGLGHIFIQTRTVGQRLLRWVVALLYRSSLRLAHRVYFLNADDLGDFREIRLVDDAKAEVIGAIGVDLARWAPAPAVIDPVAFVFVGRLLREKGIGELVQAMRQIKAKHPASYMILLGTVDSNPSSFTRTEIDAWVQEGLVTWPGQVDVQPWIARSSVFVLPSYREGVPRSTQEAMAMARPVITTDVPGCRDTVIEGQNGYLVPARDSNALAAAMSRFIDTPSLIAQMGAQSRVLAEQRFDERKANAEMIARLGL